MNNTSEMTTFSKREWNNIVTSNMNPSDVIHYFYDNMKIRKFSDILVRFAENKNVKELLIDKLCQFDETAKRDSIRKNVNNWLNDKNEPTDREELIKICFALELDEAKAQSFMNFSFEGGFHLRNPREVAFLYCIRTNKSYKEALNFIDTLKPIDGSLQNQQVLTIPLMENEEIDLKIVNTKIVSNEFANINNDDAFFTFYEDNNENFGNFHNTAYIRFMHFFSELVSPNVPTHSEKEDEYSIEYAVDTYLRMNLPLDKRTSKYSVLQKAIRRFWPNVTTIKNILNRKQDVNRKILLLLYVITEGYGYENVDNDLYLECMTTTEMLEEHAWKINLMLHECGMGMLDPRNPFDWLILYSLKTSDDDKGMSERLQEILEILFPIADEK